jgi:NAD(P)-dependent dehydrogenase (short-subunit alcohol dehydrogenase family)
MSKSYFKPAYPSAFVTGGGSGIGRAVTLALAEEGVDVWITGRREEKLRETVELAEGKPGKVQYVTSDIRVAESVDAAFDNASAGGTPQALVHAAAEVYPCLAEQLTPEIFAEATQSQLIGSFHVFQAWARRLIKQERPGVVLAYTTCVSGRETAGLSHSSATKAGVEGLIRTWAVELGMYGLRLNAIGPGLFPMQDTLHMRDSFWDLDFYRSNIPLARFGEPDEIVGPSLFMLSRSAGYVTGEIFHIDGGLRLRPNYFYSREGMKRFGKPV